MSLGQHHHHTHHHEHGQGHDHAHDHGHDHGGHAHAHARIGAPPGSSVRRMTASLVLTVLIMVAEAVGGWLSGSLALLSDAGHMLTDAASLGLALFAMVFATRPADLKRTYGYRRAEVLAAQFNVVALFGLTIWIAWEAIDRLREPPRDIHVGVMAAIGAIGLAANLTILSWLRKDHGLNVRAAFLHVLSDAVASVGVIVAAGLIRLDRSFWWIDPVLSMAIAALILWGALGLVYEVMDILMEAVPKHLDAEEVARAMEGANRSVVAIHDLHIWTISTGMYALSAHLVVGPDCLARCDDILHEVKGFLRATYRIDHTTLQIESNEYDHAHDVHAH
jgi:cobalt-zinc-cadmium efflux system protein